MTHTEEHEERIYNSFIAFRAPKDFLERFQQFSRDVGRNKSAVARYLIAECMNAYEGKKEALTKIRQELY
jgi:predicted DNA-binding protein